MDFTEITLNQIIVVVVVGVLIGVGFRFWRDHQARQAALAAVAPYSPVPIAPPPAPAPVVAPAPATAQPQPQYPGYFDPLAAARWDAIRHQRALNTAVEDMTAVQMLELRAMAGVQLQLDQEAQLAGHMQAMRAGRFAPPGSATGPATTVNVNAPSPSPAMTPAASPN